MTIKLLTILTGIMIAGEALALLVGMHILSQNANQWISFKNDLLVGFDLIAGLGLILVVTMNKSIYTNTILWELTLMSVVAHGYREWEYIVGTGNEFCVNMPLFVMNNFKLIGLLVILILSV